MTGRDRLTVQPPSVVAAPPDRAADSRGRDHCGGIGRSFVVQLASGCELADGHVAGRVQHLATHDGGNFDSTRELVDVMRRVLERLEIAGSNDE